MHLGAAAVLHVCSAAPFALRATCLVMNEPPIQVLAARQQAASILAENWPTVSERLGDVLTGADVCVRASQIHGVGLFAARPIEAGEIVALHPVHRVLQVLDDGRITGALVDEADQAYFRPAPGEVEPDELAYRQVAYRQTYSHVNPQRPERFLLDANPTKADVVGWMAHRCNDGASLAPGASGDDIVGYYERSNAARNCCMISLCVPLLALVTTKTVAEGEELLVTCGHGYWTQSELLKAGEKATEVSNLAASAAREADLWQVATDKKFSKHIAALDDFITKTSADFMGGDAADEAPRAPNKPSPPPKPKNGFGSGSSSSSRASSRNAKGASGSKKKRR